MANKNYKKNLIIYKPLTTSDIGDVIRLHEQWIPSAGAKMGMPYLKKLYVTLFSHPNLHVIIGAFKSHRLVGFISVTNNSKATGHLLNRHLFSLIPTVLIGLVNNRYSIADLLSHRKAERTVQRLIGESGEYILGIAVDPEVQRQGIATQLIKRIINKKNILVDTQTSNVVAQKFYKKLGFVPVKSITDSIVFCWKKQ
jgi:ribosomal protein S18 acetylase RimI-like enzyme